MSYQRRNLKQNAKQININRFSYLLKDPEVTQQSQLNKKQKKFDFGMFSCLSNNKCKETKIQQFNYDFNSTEQIKTMPLLINETQKFKMQQFIRSKDSSIQIQKLQNFAFKTPRKEQKDKIIELSTHYQSKSFSIASQPITLEKQSSQQNQFFRKPLQYLQNQYEQDSSNDKEQNSSLRSSSSFLDHDEIKKYTNYLKTYQIKSPCFSKNQNGIKTPNKQKLKLVSQIQKSYDFNKKQKPQKYIIAKQQRVKTQQMSLKLSQCQQKQSILPLNVMTPKSIKLKGKSNNKSLKKLNQRNGQN